MYFALPFSNLLFEFLFESLKFFFVIFDRYDLFLFDLCGVLFRCGRHAKTCTVTCKLVFGKAEVVLLLCSKFIDRSRTSSVDTIYIINVPCRLAFLILKKKKSRTSSSSMVPSFELAAYAVKAARYASIEQLTPFVCNTLRFWNATPVMSLISLKINFEISTCGFLCMNLFFPSDPCARNRRVFAPQSSRTYDQPSCL